MQFTNEQLYKAKKAKSAEELFAIAKQNGVELTEEQAKTYFAELHQAGELTDEELSAVAGGKGDPDPKFKNGDHVSCWYGSGYITNVSYDSFYGVWYYMVVVDGRGECWIKEKDISLT